MSNPIFTGPLTKRALLALPDGAFLVSGTTNETGIPLIAEMLPPTAQREMFWQMLKVLQLDGRRFWAFASASDSSSFFATILNQILTPPISPNATIH